MDKQKNINFLSKLELQGFKSFASKTVFDFPEKVVCIVGPNGSGKSNIIDAVRWVLGEREAKNLRGENIENLIFAGTPQKSASGFARVDLVFNNYEKLFPLDTEEVVLTRKVDRSGTSTFFLNEVEVKLKDLLPLLAKMKLGSRGITIIRQGQSDIFVTSSPYERREMIEEILGLKEFRIKKLQSEKRLENSLINIDKIKATLAELAPQVRVYKKQKSRLEKRAEIENELKTLEEAYFAFRYQNLKKLFLEINEPLKNLFSHREKLEKEIQKKESNLNTFYKNNLYEELPKIREEINKLWNQKVFREKELAKIESKIETKKEGNILVSKSEELSSLIENLQKEIKKALSLENLSDIKNILRWILDQINKFFKQEEKSESKKWEEESAIFKNEINQLEIQIKNLQQKEEELVKKEKEENISFKEQINELNQEKDKLRALEKEIQEKELQKQSIQIRIEEVEREWQALGNKIEDLAHLKKEKDFTDNELKQAASRLLHLRGELTAIGEIDQNVLKEFENAEQKFNFLSGQLEDLEKAAKDLKILIKDLESRIQNDFKKYFREISDAFNEYFQLMFGGGRARFVLEKQQILEENEAEEEKQENKEEYLEEKLGVEIEINLPRKKIKSIDMLSGGEKTLVSLAALFALISVSPPPFLVLDETDAALDEENARRFAELIRQFSSKTQFVIVTHNRATMEAADVLYGITMGEDGVSKVLSLKLE